MNILPVVVEKLMQMPADYWNQFLSDLENMRSPPFNPNTHRKDGTPLTPECRPGILEVLSDLLYLLSSSLLEAQLRMLFLEKALHRLKVPFTRRGSLDKTSYFHSHKRHTNFWMYLRCKCLKCFFFRSARKYAWPNIYS